MGIIVNNDRTPSVGNLSPLSSSGGIFAPRYTFYLTRRHSGEANIAFMDGHIEVLTLRELTLPVESVQRRWHPDNKAHWNRLRAWDTDNWAPFRSIDEEFRND